MVSLTKIHNASQDDEPANISYRGVVNALNDDRRFNFLEVDGMTAPFAYKPYSSQKLLTRSDSDGGTVEPRLRARERDLQPQLHRGDQAPASKAEDQLQ